MALRPPSVMPRTVPRTSHFVEWPIRRDGAPRTGGGGACRILHAGSETGMPEPSRDFRRSDWLFCLFLVVLSAKVYGEVFHHDFIRFDTPRYVTKNPHVLAGLTRDGVVWAFTTLYKSNWHPLTWISHMLDVSLFGVNAGAHHAVSLAFHAVDACLLYAVFLMATGARGASAFVAAVFAVHPTHVESVAWIAERKDVLSLFFGLLSLRAYLRYTAADDRARAARDGPKGAGARRRAAARSGDPARRIGHARMWPVGVWLLCALASKPMLVTLPFVFLLFDYWPLGRIRSDRPIRPIRPILMEKVPLFVLVIVVSGVTYFAQKSSGAVDLGDPVGFVQRLANAVVSYTLYIGKTFWPTNLALVYPHPDLPGGTPWQPWQIGASTGVLAAVTAAVVLARRRRYLAVGWLWFLGTLVPVIGIVQAGTQGFADRYTYLPGIGLSLMIAWGGRDLAGRFGAAGRVIVVGSAVVVIGLLAVVARRQVAPWRSSIPLFEHSLAIEPGSTMLRNNLANELFDRGFVDASIEHYRTLLAYDPGSRVAHRNLSNALQKKGDLYEATRHLLLARGVELDSLEGQLNLGGIARREGRVTVAEGHFRRAIELAPDSPDAHRMLGLTLLQRGQNGAAVEQFRELVRLAPSSPDHRIVLAQTLRVEGDLDGAIAELRRAVATAPDRARTHAVLADALLAHGDHDEAVSHLREAVALEPDDPDYAQRLASALRE